ncbi:sigma-70 family RNA polymerase sigma factor [Niastella caeni]|uniref:Sigma-70 family RNA polymerase sigma factor n=1 Tax=Niastella caeni TaxID=2569763 RepID=A0A4S8HH58_9BACT|nr:sigma-70 family RNA polymerase sigma factor [Niastella caeni]THU32914.1 sigma-70 family RNA polymerase sigma factor [Niastella caeni]
MKQLTDELLNEFSQGSPHAFQTIFDSFRMRIFYFVKKLIDDRLIAEEITSDTFVKLYRLHDRFNTLNNIQAFLFITARNASLDYLKYRQRQRLNLAELQAHEEQEIDFPLFAETNIQADVLQFIYEEIEKLPQRSKTIFKLFYIEGVPVRDIANMMKISPQTVANQKHTALKLLRMKVLDRPGLLLWLLFLAGEKR